VAGIETKQEKNIFGYRGEASRPIPNAEHPIEFDLDITDEVLQERANILNDAHESDTLIDDTISDIIAQLENFDIDPEDPEVKLAVQRLGGETITFGIYNRSLNILRNASIAALCVDPVHLIFANSDENGPQIPRLPTTIVTCADAANPRLFDYSKEDAKKVGNISLYDAKGMRKQMTRYRTILLVWYGVGILILKTAITALESMIRKLRWLKFVGGPIRRALTSIRDWLRSLVCKFEIKVYGKPLSNFCNGNRRLIGVDDQYDRDVPEGTTFCEETNSEGEVIREVTRVDPDGIDDIQKIGIEGWKQEDCMAEEVADSIPDSVGCPNYIPQECIDSAQTIADRVHDWALDQNNTVNGPTNPQAIMIWPIVNEIIDIQETGKFMLTSHDNSELSDKLKETTNRRGFSRARWAAPIVTDFVEAIKPGRIEYSSFSANRNVEAEDCDE